MTHAIVRQLVRKDFLIWRRLILIFYGVSLTCIAVLGVLYGRIPEGVLVNLGGTLLITPVGTLGVVLLMQTNVFEKAKSTQPFIMSLPVTVREFTLAKLLVNVPVFGALWLVTTGAAFWFAFGLDLMPLGTLPVMTMVFLGVFVAYVADLGLSRGAALDRLWRLRSRGQPEPTAGAPSVLRGARIFILNSECEGLWRLMIAQLSTYRDRRRFVLAAQHDPSVVPCTERAGVAD